MTVSSNNTIYFSRKNFWSDSKPEETEEIFCRVPTFENSERSMVECIVVPTEVLVRLQIYAIRKTLWTVRLRISNFAL